MVEDEHEIDFSEDAAPPSDPNGNKCGVCGEEYGRPLLAEILSGSSVEEYYACSRCLSRVAEVKPQNYSLDGTPEPDAELDEPKFTDPEPINVDVKTSCQHEPGYLKRRDKSSPIPDECLICTKMIECM